MVSGQGEATSLAFCIAPSAVGVFGDPAIQFALFVSHRLLDPSSAPFYRVSVLRKPRRSVWAEVESNMKKTPDHSY